jgi:hypothetical protein
MVLWGTDNMKSEGLQIAQAMSLIGARPRIDSYGRVVGAELVPLAQLGRPRVDVVVTLGIFRDSADADAHAGRGRAARRQRRRTADRQFRAQAHPGPPGAARLRF